METPLSRSPRPVPVWPRSEFVTNARGVAWEAPFDWFNWTHAFDRREPPPPKPTKRKR